MYEYIPLDTTIERHYNMMEANMMIFHRDESTREIIKWSLMCALTKDCIEPEGAFIYCSREDEKSPEGICHRQDQSVFNVLLANYERQLEKRGNHL